MARSRRNATSDESDSDAPETITLTQSKKHSKTHDAAIQQVQAAQKEKKRLRNQHRDKRLKEQAESSKKKRKAKEPVEDAGLQARMERAMQEAADEDERDEDVEGDAADGEHEMSEGEEFMGPSEANDDGVGEGMDDDEDNAYSDDESMDAEPASTPIPPSAQSKPNPKHLPDHLFASAFSSQAEKAKSQSKAASKRKATDEGASSRSARKRTRSNASPKDLLIGSRAIRTLPQNQYPSGAATIPSAKVKKFINRSLALKGGNSKTRGWERRPANVGVMRRDGPAAHFVRNR